MTTNIPSADGHPPPIKPKCTEPYYTSPVLCIDKYGHSAIEPDYSTCISHMAECRCTDLVSLSHSLLLSVSLSTSKRPPCKLSPSQYSPTTPSFLLSSFSIIITLQLTVFMQFKHSFSMVVIFNCHHFATDHLQEYVQFTIYHL